MQADAQNSGTFLHAALMEVEKGFLVRMDGEIYAQRRSS